MAKKLFVLLEQARGLQRLSVATAREIGLRLALFVCQHSGKRAWGAHGGITKSYPLSAATFPSCVLKHGKPPPRRCSSSVPVVDAKLDDRPLTVGELPRFAGSWVALCTASWGLSMCICKWKSSKITENRNRNALC